MEDKNPKKMRTITLEEHYATPAFMEASKHRLRDQARKVSDRGPGPTLVDRLCDLGDSRIEEMDAAGIDVQVLSLTSPGVQQMEAAEAVAIAREQNDYLADRVRHYPDRLAGFAALPTPVPDEAAEELERTVSEYGFKGAAIMGHTQGRYLDDEFFWPILESAAALEVPIYIHPTPPPQKVIEASYTGNYAPNVTVLLSTRAWGWHIETGIHSLRLVASGVFDRYPDLQILIGHLGEAIPFMLSRIDQRLRRDQTHLERSTGAYFRENFSYTFSGFNYLPAFLDLLLQVGVERILFSADYPYSSMESARNFLDQLPVSPADKEQIAHGNAERLLQIQIK
jgi:predicted TIM-barrel fold metal-dependent hydrolase